jgi:hypothetical protein
MIETPPPITFQQLMSKHERIRIPRLQRDYAQGRKGAKETEVRERFLEVLRNALERRVDANFAPQNLDFVYGSAETIPDKHFSPLDGQQRLTTIFLLHWLLAWRDGDDCWKHFTDSFREGKHSRFSYRVRTSSTEFFDMLVEHRPILPAAGLPDLKGWITDQPWYFRYWRLDPTIQAVLEMLQAMHVFFADRRLGELYARLTDEKQPAITFQLLDLGNFPLSDDLYIKMNARGKALTTFETFKGRYEQKLPAHFPSGAQRDIGGVPFLVAEFVARRMDTAWTDFFWAHHRALGQLDPQRLDESFMNVFRMVALVSRDPANDTHRADIELLRDDANPPAYSTFDARGWLDPAFSSLLVSLMETWCAAGTLLPPDGPFEEQTIFRQLLDDPDELTVPQVILFCGYALFIQEHERRLDPVQFADWMRVVHNLGVNSDIDRNERLQNPAKGLRELLPHSSAILPRIAGFGTHGRATGFSDQQQREEALKAGLLLADPAGWRPLIERAERHGYFRGQIEFLLDFSGVSAEWEKTGDCAWDAAKHLSLQDAFLGYLEKAEAMFDASGLVDVGEARWQRALLSIGDYLLPNGWTNMSFLVNDVSKPYSWKRLLRGEAGKRLILQQLWDHPDYGQPLPAHLDVIINAATGLEPWREALVKDPAALRYCERRNIQRTGNHVVLLSSERRSAPHAELFTFLLHHRLQPPAPFTLGAYFFRDEPHFPLHFMWGEKQFSLLIYGRDENFDLWIEASLPPDLLVLFAKASFAPSAEQPGWLVRTANTAALEPALNQLAALLTAP